MKFFSYFQAILLTLAASSFVTQNLPGGQEADTFDEFLQNSVDKANAYKNWGTCSYWMSGISESNADRKHDSTSVENGTGSDNSSSRKKHATLKDCMDETDDRGKCERVFEPLTDGCSVNGRSIDSLMAVTAAKHRARNFMNETFPTSTPTSLGSRMIPTSKPLETLSPIRP